jgi:hypothetical protein
MFWAFFGSWLSQGYIAIDSFRPYGFSILPRFKRETHEKLFGLFHNYVQTLRHEPSFLARCHHFLAILTVAESSVDSHRKQGA